MNPRTKEIEKAFDRMQAQEGALSGTLSPSWRTVLRDSWRRFHAHFNHNPINDLAFACALLDSALSPENTQGKQAGGSPAEPANQCPVSENVDPPELLKVYLVAPAPKILLHLLNQPVVVADVPNVQQEKSQDGQTEPNPSGVQNPPGSVSVGPDFFSVIHGDSQRANRDRGEAIREALHRLRTLLNGLEEGVELCDVTLRFRASNIHS